MKALLVISLATVAAAFKIDPFEYLEKYGYSQSSNSFSDYHDAITKFQKFAHLPATGVIDDATMKMMEMPRCGVKDVLPASFHRDVRKKRYIATSRYRKNKEMTYTYLSYSPDLGREATRRVIRQALDIWSNATNVVFREVTGTSATLMLRFRGGQHSCPYPFDGPGGTLAHAFYPDNGGVHFDEDEFFTDGEDKGINLLWVATHEFGHSLGLPHSDVYEALMYPFYKKYVPDFKLPADDTGAVQALYGCKNDNRNPISIPKDGAPYQGLLMERWTNQLGSAIHHIEPDVCVYPHQPNEVGVLQSFEAPENSDDDFATRIRGFYRATKTGYHRFYLCADHSAKLYVSSSASPADKQELIKVDKPTSKELRFCSQKPTRDHLQAGQAYYIEAIHKDSVGDDFLKLGVKHEDDRTPLQVITSQDANWALTDTELRVIVCLGRYEALTCPESHKIEVTKAAYGMFTSNSKFYEKVRNLCNYGQWSRSTGTSRGNCAAPSSLYRVQAACHGKQQCTLYAHDSEFPDHCGRLLYSVLDVTYKCVTNVTTAPVTQAPPTQPPTTQAPTTQGPTTEAPCIDKYKGCTSWANAGYCSRDYIRNRDCRRSCNVCKAPSTQAPSTQAPSTQAPTTQAPTTEAPCIDKYKECAPWAAAGYCYMERIKNIDCRRSCNVCKVSTTPPPPTTAQPCLDRPTEAPHCPAWKKRGYCRTHRAIREKYCRKTCGTCS